MVAPWSAKLRARFWPITPRPIRPMSELMGGTVTHPRERAPAATYPGRMADPVIGIDIGGSGIKGNLVDLDLGEPTGDRLKVSTPDPSTPEAVAEVIMGMVDHFGVPGPVGCTFPAVVRHGVTMSAANVDDSWIGTDAAALFTSVTGRKVSVVNDADAAGLAEMAFGA